MDLKTKVDILEKAIKEERMISILYWAKKDGKVSTKVITPTSIKKNKFGIPEYVYGYYDDGVSVRMFKIDRILSISGKGVHA